MSYEYIKKLLNSYKKNTEIYKDNKNSCKPEYRDAGLELLDIERKLKFSYDELIKHIPEEKFNQINAEIYGPNYTNNYKKIVLDSNAFHIYDDFKDDPDFFKGCDMNNVGINVYASYEYGNYLNEIIEKFIDTGKSDEEILADPDYQKFLDNKRREIAKNSPEGIIFLPSIDRTDLAEDIKNDPTHRIKPEDVVAQKERDKVTLRNMLSSARKYKNFQNREKFDITRIKTAVKFKAGAYGIKELLDSDYNNKVLDLADKYIDKNILDSVGKKIEDIKNISEYEPNEYLVKHEISPEINDLIKDLEENKVQVPEGKTKEGLINALKTADSMLTNPIPEYKDYMVKQGSIKDAFNQHNDEYRTIENLKTLENGRFYHLYEDDEKRENDLLAGKGVLPLCGNVKKGREKDAKDYAKLKFDFSPEYINEVKTVVKRLQDLEILPKNQVLHEEGQKVYAFRKVADSKTALLTAIKNKDLAHIEELTNKFVKDYNDIKEVYDIVKKWKKSSVPANVGTERNTLVPYEFAADYETASLLNSLFILSQALASKNQTIEQFLDNPLLLIENDLNAVVNQYGLNGHAKGLMEKHPDGYGKSILIAELFSPTEVASQFQNKTAPITKGIADRGILGIVDGEPDQDKKTNSLTFVKMITATSGDNLADREFDKIMYFMDNKNDLEILSNIILLQKEDIDMNKIKPGVNYYSDGIQYINPKIDRGQYILDKGLTAGDVYRNALNVITSLPRVEEDDEDAMIFEFDKEKIMGKSMLATMTIFNEYIMAHPEEKDKPEFKQMKDFIKDPLKVVNRELAAQGNRFRPSNKLKDAFTNYKQELMAKQADASEVEKELNNNVIKPFVKSEKEFNKVAANIIKDIKKLSEKIGRGVNVEENTRLLFQAQNKYKLFAGDKTIELIDRYKRGLIPESYLKTRIKNINEMNIKPKDSVDLFKNASQKEKSKFYHDYKQFNLEGKLFNNEVPKDLKVMSTNMSKISGDMDIVSDFTEDEMNLINKSLNKDIYRNIDNLEADLNNVLGIKEEPKIEINYDDSLIDDSRVQIHIDLNESKESKKSQFIDNDNKAIEKEHALDEDVKDSLVK